MWDYLGVSDNYKTIFLNMAKSLNQNTLNEYLNYEIESLKKFNEILGVIYLN